MVVVFSEICTKGPVMVFLLVERGCSPFFADQLTLVMFLIFHPGVILVYQSVRFKCRDGLILGLVVIL